MGRCANLQMSRRMFPNSPERLVSHWTLDRPAGAEGVRDIFRSIGAYFEQLEVFGIRRTHEVKCFVISGRCDRVEIISSACGVHLRAEILPKPVTRVPKNGRFLARPMNQTASSSCFRYVPETRELRATMIFTRARCLPSGGRSGLSSR